MKMLRVWMLLVVMLAACGDGGPGSISGQVGFFRVVPGPSRSRKSPLPRPVKPILCPER